MILFRAQLASHDSVKSLLQKERDLAQDELANMNSVLEQETASLKFQLSTVQMELAQERKVIQYKLLEDTPLLFLIFTLHFQSDHVIMGNVL